MSVAGDVVRARRLTEPNAEVGRVARPNAWWGMLLFVATEATLFAVLFASYFYLRFRSGPTWPPRGIAAPGLTLPLAMTALLSSSSIPAWLAERGIRRGDRVRLESGLTFSFLLGAFFLLLQAHEFVTKAREHPPGEGVYPSLFFTVSGLHGSHVVVGVTLLGWALVRSWTGSFTPERHTGVQVVVLYWHFVHVAWLFVLATLYLSPRV